MSKKYLIPALIFIIGMASISVVGAADDSANDTINAYDNPEITLEQHISENSLTNDDGNEESVLEKDVSIEDDDNLTSDGRDIDSTKKDTAQKEKVNKKEITVSKKTSKLKTAFKTIGKNSKDKAAVKKIQIALKKNGYYLRYKGHYLKVDGWFGPCTERSVKEFQKAKKLKVTGKVDRKTAEKLKIIDKTKPVKVKTETKPVKVKTETNSVIKFENYNTFYGEYNSGKSFEVKIINKTTRKGIETLLRTDFYKNGKNVHCHFYYTDSDGVNDITPDELEIGTYKVKVSCEEPNIKVKSKYRSIVIQKTSIKLKATDIKDSGSKNIKLKATLRFKNNGNVNEGNVKFKIDGKSYVVKVHNGVAILNLKLKNLKSDSYEVTFLGTKNIRSKSVTEKIMSS